MTTRAGAAVLGGVLAVGALAGCGGSDDTKDQDQPSSSTTTEETSADSTPSGYLPVPAGVTLTEAGTALGFGDQATVAWRPRQDAVVSLDLTVDRIDQTSFKESFEGWVVTKQMKRQVPYFVHATATNVGEADVSSLLVPLYGLSSADTMYEPLSFRDKAFEPCPGGDLPERLRPGKSADLCFVYLLPDDQQITAAAFDVAGDLDPITWTGTVTAIEKPDKDKKHKKHDKDKKHKKGGKGG
jgi:hypothetical protein